MNVTYQNKLDFFSRGWTIIEMGFSKEEIKKYYESTLLLKNKASSINYPLQRCYFPHLFHKNIAAIESPFNKLIINSGVEELFQRPKPHMDPMFFSTVDLFYFDYTN